MKSYDEKYLKLLKQSYPTRQSVCREIINLSAITNLPKGTEYFMSDLHGEYESFLHLLNNCSGVIREKVDDLFAESMSQIERRELCTLVYYPKQKLALLHEAGQINENWYKMNLGYLIEIAKLLSSKYTRSKVRKALPPDFAYIIDELLHINTDEDANQLQYHMEILHTIIALDNADEFILALADLIKRLAVDHLHIVGDIYDRGGSADRIMELIYHYHSIDIEWGNHDILWMGAACGNEACIANVLHNNLKYQNTEILEHAYGISLRPLFRYAMTHFPEMDSIQAADYAITMMLFKLEGQLIQAHPEYEMDDRLLLSKIDPKNSTIALDGDLVPIELDGRFDSVDWENPYALSNEEEEIMEKLKLDFTTSAMLRKHVDFLYDKGSMYKIFNGNLLYHGCLPLDENGNFEPVQIGDRCYQGKALMDFCDEAARLAHSGHGSKADIDFMWFLWGSEKSPICGRKVKTFERFFCLPKQYCEEPSNPYYRYYYKESICQMILHEFGLYAKDSHIINGHTPVHAISGEEPIRANDRLFVIDGGFCKTMNEKTGIAGYTLIFNSHGLRLKAHRPFTSVEDAILNNADIDSETKFLPLSVDRLLVRDTDTGDRLLQEIEDLKMLYENYGRIE